MQKSVKIGIVVSIFMLAGCQSNQVKNHIVSNSPTIEPEVILGKSQILTILPTKVACSTPQPMQCFLAKTQDNTVSTFQIPYQWIEGFSALPYTHYQIEVKPWITKHEQKLTGKWVLQKIISQKVMITTQH